MATVGPVGQFADAFKDEFTKWWIDPASRAWNGLPPAVKDLVTVGPTGLFVDKFIVDINGVDTPPVEMFFRAFPGEFRDRTVKPVKAAVSTIADVAASAASAVKSPFTLTLGLVAVILLAVFVLFGPAVRAASGRIGAVIA